MATAILIRPAVVRERPGRARIRKIFRRFFERQSVSLRRIIDNPEPLETVLRIGIANM